MTEAEIWSNIRYNEQKIDEHAAEIRRLERQINELEALRNKCGSLQSRFSERQQHRQGRLQDLLSSSLQNQIVRRYYNGMSSLLSGREFNEAYEGLNEAKRMINHKIRNLDQELDEAQASLNYRRNRREYWLRELWNLPD